MSAVLSECASCVSIQHFQQYRFSRHVSVAILTGCSQTTETKHKIRTNYRFLWETKRCCILNRIPFLVKKKPIILIDMQQFDLFDRSLPSKHT